MWETLVLMTLFCFLETSGNAQWPAGTYGIPKPATGCPSAEGFQWKQGWRLQATESDHNSNNGKSVDFHLDAIVDGKKINRSFCIKTDITTGRNRPAWPPGQYCIYNRGGCPARLTKGFVRWDDDDGQRTTGIDNQEGGIIPNGEYDRNTKIEFCCRTDGSKSHPISLPTQAPFFLLAYGSEKCQMVKWTIATQEWIRYDTENNRNEDQANGTFPYRGGEKDPTIHYCYYQGCSVNLTEGNGTFRSPSYQGKNPSVHCSWRIMVGPAQRIFLTFTYFRLQGGVNNDSVFVYDGEDATGKVLGVFNGGHHPSKEGINSSSNRIAVVFKSDNHTKHGGFSVSYFAFSSSVPQTSTNSGSPPTSPSRTQTSHSNTLKRTDENLREGGQTQRSRSKAIIYGPVIGGLLVALIVFVAFTMWKFRKRQRNYNLNQTLELRPQENYEVNIEPSKTSSGNGFDMTVVTLSLERLEATKQRTSSDTKLHESEPPVTHGHFAGRFQEEPPLEKRSSAMDCLNRSLKGLSISLEGEINVKVAVKMSTDKS